MTFEEKEKAFTKLIQEEAAKEGCFFIEDSGEGHDMELADIYLEDVAGWLAPVGTPREKAREQKYYCFAEWEINDSDNTVTIKFVKY